MRVSSRTQTDIMEIITTQVALEQAVQAWLELPCLALDTEFFWERTFYPILGVVQVASDADHCYLIDAVQIQDLSALAPVLASGDIVKILHDAVQDLSILKHATGAAPTNVFDTRLAAGFAGLPSILSLQALLRDVLSVDLPKTETRSNWLRRPLSASQLCYAANDVVTLPELRERLLARCASELVRGWLHQEMARLNDPTLYNDHDPREMYRRVKGHGRLKARPLAVLREVAEWREHVARQRDWPRGHVLPDTLLLQLAIQAPRERGDLERLPGWPLRLPAELADDLLVATTRGLDVSENECPAANGRGTLNHDLRTEMTRLTDRIHHACATHGIDPAVVGSRTDLERYLELKTEGKESEHPLAQGWRRELLAACPSTQD